MARPPTIPADKKTRIVLDVLAGEITISEAARREQVSEQSISRWKADFLEAGRTILATGRVGPTSRQEQLEAQVERVGQYATVAKCHPRPCAGTRQAGTARASPRPYAVARRVMFDEVVYGHAVRGAHSSPPSPGSPDATRSRVTDHVVKFDQVGALHDDLSRLA